MLAHAPFVGFVPVHDVSKAREFYETTLGLEVVEETPFALVVNANGVMLRVTPIGQFVVQPFTIAGWDVADIDATVGELTDKGVAFCRYEGMDQDDLGIWTSPNGDRIAWFKDPDENTLSLTAFAAK